MFCHARACACVCVRALGKCSRSRASFGQRLPCRAKFGRRPRSRARFGHCGRFWATSGRPAPSERPNPARQRCERPDSARRPPSVRITPGNVGGAPTPSDNVHRALCHGRIQHCAPRVANPPPLAFSARLKNPSFMQSTEYKMFPRGKMSVGDRDEREARGGSELCEPQVSGEIAPGLWWS